MTTLDSAALALAYAPSSEILWYADLEIFPVIQKSYFGLSYFDIPYFQLYFIAPIFALACYGLAAARGLPIAIASNLSFVYASFLAFCWVTANLSFEAASLGQVSLPSISVPSGPGVYLVITLVCASLLSFSISHFHYIRKIPLSL